MYQTLRNLFLRNERLSVFSLGGVMLVAIVLMGIINLASLNGKALQGYQLNKLESERQELVTDGEITDMLSLRARSMDAIESRTASMTALAREDITYVIPVNAFAQNGSTPKQ